MGVGELRLKAMWRGRGGQIAGVVEMRGNGEEGCGGWRIDSCTMLPEGSRGYGAGSLRRGVVPQTGVGYHLLLALTH